MTSRPERSFEGAKFDNTSINNWKLLLEVKFSQYSTKTTGLFALDFSEVIVDSGMYENVLINFASSLPPFSLIRDFGNQNIRGNVSKIFVSLACY